MIIVDTNVLSELVKPHPDDGVRGWAEAVHGASLSTTATVLAEILDGLSRLPGGRRRDGLALRLSAAFTEVLGERVLPFDRVAAHAFAEVVAVRRRAGRPIATQDAQIAAVTLVHDANLVTRNVRDFEGCGIRLINPWSG